MMSTECQMLISKDELITCS